MILGRTCIIPPKSYIEKKIIRAIANNLWQHNGNVGGQDYGPLDEDDEKGEEISTVFFSDY